jgi:hypothetical protein
MTAQNRENAGKAKISTEGEARLSRGVEAMTAWRGHRRDQEASDATARS